MFAVKVLHGYITYNGTRTRDKGKAKRFSCSQEAELFANKIGGRVKQIA